MSHDALQTAPTFACRADDVPQGEGRTIVVDSKPVAIFRTASGWYAVDAVCPHEGGPLADGLVCDDTVICPLHERRFDLATGVPLSAGEGITAYAVELRGDRVFVAAT